MVDVGLHHRAINPELPAAGDLQRAGQLNGAFVERGDGLGADHVRPADEGGVVGNLLQIKAAELAQNYGLVDEALGLLVAEVVEPLYYEHPQDHLHGRRMPSTPAGVGMAFEEIGLHEVEEFVVIEQSIKVGELRFELEVELGDQLEEVHGVVPIYYHGCSAPVRVFGIEILQERPISHRILSR